MFTVLSDSDTPARSLALPAYHPASLSTLTLPDIISLSIRRRIAEDTLLWLQDRDTARVPSMAYQRLGLGCEDGIPATL